MGGSRVYVGGIPHDTEEWDLEHFFRGYGRIREILIKRRFAFVEFKRSRNAKDAICDLDGKKLLGVRVTVDVARGGPKGRDRWSGDHSKYRESIRMKHSLPGRGSSRSYHSRSSSSRSRSRSKSSCGSDQLSGRSGSPSNSRSRTKSKSPTLSAMDKSNRKIGGKRSHSHSSGSAPRSRSRSDERKDKCSDIRSRSNYRRSYRTPVLTAGRSKYEASKRSKHIQRGSGSSRSYHSRSSSSRSRSRSRSSCGSDQLSRRSGSPSNNRSRPKSKSPALSTIDNPNRQIVGKRSHSRSSGSSPRSRSRSDERKDKCFAIRSRSNYRRSFNRSSSESKCSYRSVKRSRSKSES